jgi:hypothetical protein
MIEWAGVEIFDDRLQFSRIPAGRRAETRQSLRNPAHSSNSPELLININPCIAECGSGSVISRITSRTGPAVAAMTGAHEALAVVAATAREA